MKRLQWGMCAAFVVVGLIACNKAISHIMAVHVYTVAIDPLFSEPTRSKIIACIDAAQTKKIQISELSKTLHAQFESIHSISAQLLPPNVVHIQIAGRSPVLQVNASTILTADGTLAARDDFANYRIYYLPHMRAPALTVLGKVPQALSGCIDELVHLSKDYSITWMDQFYTQLNDKVQPLFSIVCNAENIPTFKLLRSCQHLKKELEQQEVFVAKAKKSSARSWIADVRFAKQIIVYSEKKGVTYG